MPNGVIKSLYEKFRGICQRCGIKTSFDDYTYIDPDNPTKVRRRLGRTYPTKEHLIPRCLLKGQLENNLTLYCYGCNNDDAKYVNIVRMEMDRQGVP